MYMGGMGVDEKGGVAVSITALLRLAVNLNQTINV